MSDLATRIQQLVRSSDDSSATTATDSSPHRHLTKRLSRVERDLRSIVSAVDSITPDREIDMCLLNQYESQLSGIKADLTSVSHEVSRLDDDGGLSEQESSLCKVHFDVCLRIRRLLQNPAQKAPPAEDGGGVKLPKLDVPTFNGNLIDWRLFWEQFCTSVHHRSKLTDAEKLVYLKHALKDGSAI